MKKINMKSVFEILSEKEMKNVMGGSGTGTCGWSGNPNAYFEILTFPQCGLSKEEALRYFNDFGGNWCCDSCGSSTYCGDSMK